MDNDKKDIKEIPAGFGCLEGYTTCRYCDGDYPDDEIEDHESNC